MEETEKTVIDNMMEAMRWDQDAIFNVTDINEVQRKELIKKAKSVEALLNDNSALSKDDEYSLNLIFDSLESAGINVRNGNSLVKELEEASDKQLCDASSNLNKAMFVESFYFSRYQAPSNNIIKEQNINYLFPPIDTGELVNEAKDTENVQLFLPVQLERVVGIAETELGLVVDDVRNPDSEAGDRITSDEAMEIMESAAELGFEKVTKGLRFVKFKGNLGDGTEFKVSIPKKAFEGDLPKKGSLEVK